MPLYRKTIPVEISYPWNCIGDDPDVVPYLSMRPGAAPCDVCPAPLEAHGWISTLEDGHRACPGDRIVTGVAGERYPIKPHIFEQTYQPDDGTPTPGYPDRLA